MMRPQRQQRRHIARIILFACDHCHLNVELITHVFAEHLATSEDARKHILSEDNRPDSHNISSKGKGILLFRKFDPRNEISSIHRWSQGFNIKISYLRKKAWHLFAVIWCLVTLAASLSRPKVVVISSESLPNAQHRTSDAGKRFTFIEEQQNEVANK